MAWRRLLLLWMVVGLSVVAAATTVRAGEETMLRLVSLIDLDDRGESIDFPYRLHYDYWASETYLISSTNRITIYDQNFFPVASFGKGRGLGSVSSLAVDRHGNIFVCQLVEGGGDDSKRSRLTIYNQAFFPVKEIVFAMIPELAEFSGEKVAVAESGEIYLTGRWPGEQLAGVAVLTPEGNYARTLRPPEKNAYRAVKKVPPPAAKGAEVSSPPGLDQGSGAESELAAALPAGFKPKGSSRAREEDEAKEVKALPYISDVKIDRQGRIYLLSAEVSNIYVFNAQEEYLFKFGEKGGAEGKLSTPVGLAVDLERRVMYVCDYMRHTILCYDYDTGRFIFEFGGQGVGPLWFNYPNSIEVDQRGRVVVSDLFNRRLQVIDPHLENRRPLLKLSPAAPAPPPSEPPSAAGVPLPPPAPLALAPPVVGGMPVGVSSPLPPVLTAGSGLVAVRTPLTPLSPPPVRALPLLPRELAPQRLKKLAPPTGIALVAATIAPLSSPRLMRRPGSPSFPGEGRGSQASRVLADSFEFLLERLRSVPPAVGVYGPVAVIVGVGGQLLITNR